MSILIFLHLILSAALLGIDLVSLFLGLHPADRLPIGFALDAHALHPGACAGCSSLFRFREV